MSSSEDPASDPVTSDVESDAFDDGDGSDSMFAENICVP